VTARIEPKCRHTPVGRVAWPTGMPRRDEAHASTVVCEQPDCQDDASRWVEHITGHRGQFVPFNTPALARQTPASASAGQLNLFTTTESEIAAS
jgi:hypothetical protein